MNLKGKIDTFTGIFLGILPARQLARGPNSLVNSFPFSVRKRVGRRCVLLNMFWNPCIPWVCDLVSKGSTHKCLEKTSMTISKNCIYLMRDDKLLTSAKSTSHKSSMPLTTMRFRLNLYVTGFDKVNASCFCNHFFTFVYVVGFPICFKIGYSLYGPAKAPGCSVSK